MFTENTAAAAKGVIENFETLNRTAGAESRASKAVPRPTGRSSTISGARSPRRPPLRRGAAEMRSATQEMQSDLDMTRSELKKGVLDLPEEARESTAAMRRVVGDQIEALSELSEIISRHGKTLDISTRRWATTPCAGLIPSGRTAAGRGGRRGASRRDGNAIGQYGHGRDGTGEGGARPTDLQWWPRPSARPAAVVRPAAARPVSVRPAPAPAPCRRHPRREGGAGEKRGWVSDLLRRASREEDRSTGAEGSETSPDAAAGAPNKSEPAAAPADQAPPGGLSMDIARAIDHDAAVEIWRRHRRASETCSPAAFTRCRGNRPSTRSAQVSARREVPRSRRPLRGRLRKAARTRSATTTEPSARNAYLVSDTGKVYTMLAHASGHVEWRRSPTSLNEKGRGAGAAAFFHGL